MLANRDYNESSAYFRSLGITSATLYGPENRFMDVVPQAVFRSDVLFGTLELFEFRCLFESNLVIRQENNNRAVTPFPKQIALIDEADNILLDRFRKEARITSSSDKSPASIDQLRLIHQIGIQCKHNVEEMKGHALRNHNLKAMDEVLLQKLLRSCVVANRDRQPGIDYVVQPWMDRISDISGQQRVIIVDYLKSGERSEQSRWEGGVHQFLELRHGLTPEQMHLTEVSTSHHNYLSCYDAVIGLTGTLGTTEDRKELQQWYRVTTFEVEPHVPSKFTRRPNLYVSSDTFWDSVVNETRKVHLIGQPVLIICSTIIAAQELHRLFRNKTQLSSRLLSGTQSRSDSESIVQSAGLFESVTIGTVIASRGMDVKLTQESLQCGGLHVILTFCPDVQRVESQIFGRAARQGQPGSGQRISVFPEGYFGSVNTQIYDLVTGSQRTQRELAERKWRKAESWKHDIVWRAQQQLFEVLAKHAADALGNRERVVDQLYKWVQLIDGFNLDAIDLTNTSVRSNTGSRVDSAVKEFLRNFVGGF